MKEENKNRIYRKSLIKTMNKLNLNLPLNVYKNHLINKNLFFLYDFLPKNERKKIFQKIISKKINQKYIYQKIY